LPERLIIFRHALKNAMIPIVTVLGLQVGTLLGGAVVTETVFAWPGMGQLAVQAIYQRDYPVVQCIVLLLGAGFVLINWAVDVSYTFLDPGSSTPSAVPITFASRRPRSSARLDVCGIRLGGPPPCVLGLLGSRPGAEP